MTTVNLDLHRIVQFRNFYRPVLSYHKYENTSRLQYILQFIIRKLGFKVQKRCEWWNFNQLLWWQVGTGSKSICVLTMFESWTNLH